MSLESPPIGYPIQYYPNGDVNHPHAATVTERGMGGQVKLNYQHVGGGDLKSSGKFVRHCEDPWVKANPEIVQTRMGSWGWVPGLEWKPEPKPAEKQARSAADLEDKKEQGLAKVRELADQGLSIDEIAPKVRGNGLTKQDVEEALTQPVG